MHDRDDCEWLQRRCWLQSIRQECFCNQSDKSVFAINKARVFIRQRQLRQFAVLPIFLLLVTVLPREISSCHSIAASKQALPPWEKRFCRWQESGKTDLGQERGKTDLSERQIVIKKCHLPDSLKISSPDSLEQVKRFHSNILGRGRGVYIWSVYSTLTSAPQLLVMLSRSLCNMKCKAG